jgi:dTDP-glucose 4,6-dehydratase
MSTPSVADLSFSVKEPTMKLLITGGAGFIGSAVIRHILVNTDDQVINLDKLTYAGNLQSLSEVSESNNYAFEQVDIFDRAGLERVFREHQPDVVMHLAAQAGVRYSLGNPHSYVGSNIIAFTKLPEACRYGKSP